MAKKAAAKESVATPRQKPSALMDIVAPTVNEILDEQITKKLV